MKKILLLPITVILVFLATVTKAQDEGSLWASAVGGLNSNWIIFQNAYGNPETEYSTTFGLTGGLGVSYFFTDTWGFNGSLLTTKMGQNYNGIQSGGEADRRVKLTYLELPLLFMKRGPYSPNPTWVSFGPDIFILLRANQEYSRKGGTDLPFPDYMVSGNIRERYKPFDIGLQFAVNKMYHMQASDKLIFLVSFNSALGLTDINDKDWQIPQRDGTYKGSHNFYIGMKVGLMFDLTKGK